MYLFFVQFVHPEKIYSPLELPKLQMKKPPALLTSPPLGDRGAKP
jgi:hypothetical protein